MFAFASSAALLPRRPDSGRRRICARRARTFACAEAPPSPSSSPQEPPSASSSSPQETPHAPSADDGGAKQGRADAARREAERLRLAALEARLSAEQAQIAADRKRVVTDRLRRTVARGRGEVVESEEVAEERFRTERAERARREEERVRKKEVTRETGENLGVVDDDLKEVVADKKMAVVPEMKQTDLREKLEQISEEQLGGRPLATLLGVDYPRIAEEDIAILKEKVMSMGVFYITEVDRSPFDERVVFRGNLRVEASKALEELEAALEREGLKERIRLFLLMDPRPVDEDSEDEERPVVVALPAAAMPNKSTTPAAVLTVSAALLTIFTALSYGVGIFGLNPAFLQQINAQTLEAQQALYTLPISGGALGIVLAHEIAHRITAALNGVKLGLPVFLPSLQVGSFGTITPLQSYPRRREQLFDVAASGPVVGSAISVGLLVAGMMLTADGNVADWFPTIPTSLFNGSVLVGGLGKLLLPAAMREQATITVHPALVIGYTGMLVNALNLIPIGRLDGGRIIQALYGRAVAARVTGITFVLQGLATILGNSSLLLYWRFVATFFSRVLFLLRFRATKPFANTQLSHFLANFTPPRF